ncbi:hypothetical protein D3C86_907800 [compost metagenome]
MQPRRHAHVFPLHYVDGAAVGPVEVAQVAGEGGGRGAGGRVLIDAAVGEGIAGMEQPLPGHMHQQNGHQALAAHQQAPLSLRIVHGRERCAILERQHQMIGAAVDDRRGDAGIQAGRIIAKQRQGFAHQIRRRRFAAGRRGLQRRLPLPLLILPARDPNLGLAEAQGMVTCPEAARQRHPEGYGGMAAKRHLRLGREVAHPPLAHLCALPFAVQRGGEGRLRESNLGGDPLHLLRRRQLGPNPDTGGIAPAGSFGKGGDPHQLSDQLRHDNSLASCFTKSGVHRLILAAPSGGAHQGSAYP